MIVADTNVVSELMRDRPNPRVHAWAAAMEADEVTITAVTVEEIERGIGRLPAGRRRDALLDRWREIVDAYGDAILGYDVPAARATASVLVHREAVGRPMSLADAQIAGICVAHRATLATRNVVDFADVPTLELVDPFA